MKQNVRLWANELARSFTCCVALHCSLDKVVRFVKNVHGRTYMGVNTMHSHIKGNPLKTP